MESFPPLTGPMQRLVGIPGAPPDLSDPPAGCRFHPRCPLCVPEQRAMYARQTTERPRAARARARTISSRATSPERTR